MSATITDKFKRQVLQDLFNSFHGIGLDTGQDSDRYFVGLSRSEAWTDENAPPTPYPSKEDVREFQTSLQGIKRITDLSYVLPRHNWSAGSVYTPWSNNRHSDTTVGALKDVEGSYYVMTDEHNVYVCLQQGMTDEGVVRNSIYKPTSVALVPFEAGPDGYVWKFMYNVGVFNSRRYLTSEYIPVEQIVDSSLGGPAAGSLSASRIAQVLVQYNSIPGQILGVDIANGGSGYTTPPTITINGEGGDSAKAYGRLDVNGSIFQVVMKDSEDAANFSFGSHYTKKTWITVSGDGGAELVPVIHSDSGGLGFDPRTDLNAASLMYSVRIVGSEDNVFSTNNDFRQVGLIKNPMKDSVNNINWVDDSYSSRFVTAPRGSALKKLYVGSGIVAENAENDNIVTGDLTGAQAVLDYYGTYIDSDCCDSDLNVSYNVLYVHQNISTGFNAFDSAESVTLSNAGGTANIAVHDDSSIPAMQYAAVDNFSGEVLYIDNRLEIDRDPDQTEDIKIVIDL